MSDWIVAASVAGLAAALLVPYGRRRAYRRGYFERATQTNRPRSERRTTIGGLVLVVATAAGVAALRPSGHVTIAVLVGGAVLAVAGLWTDRTRGGPELLLASRVLAAVAVPLTGVRAHTTGLTSGDVVVTTLLVLAVMASFSAVDRTEGAALALALPSLGAITALAVAGHQPHLAIVSGAVLGAGAGVLLHNLPPAATLLGRTGGAFLGLAVAATGIELVTPAPAPGSLVVPVLLVGLPCLAALTALVARLRRPAERGIPLHHLDRRLRTRRLGPLAVVLVLALVQGVLAALAWAAGDERIAPLAALAAGAVVIVIVLVVAGTARVYEQRATGLPRPVWAGIAIATAVLVLLAVPSLLAIMRARSQLESGRRAAQAGLDAANDGDVDTAQRQFRSAEDSFEKAHDDLSSPLVSVSRVVPVLSPNVAGVRTITDVGLDLASVGVQLANRAGANSLHMVDGQFPIADVRRFSSDLDLALATLDRSSSSLHAIRNPFLVQPVTAAVDTLDQKIGRATGQATTAAEAARLAPGLLGADGPRRYFLSVVTPTELRGSGGIMGSWGFLTTDNGRVDLSEVRPIRQLNERSNRDARAAALPPVYRELYSGFEPDRFWQNITAPPDFPTVAAAIEANLPAAGEAPVDGVIQIDPEGLVGLLKIVGQVKVQGWPDPISAKNAEQVLLFDQYVRLSGETRDDFLGEVAKAVFDKLKKGSLPAPSEMAKDLSPFVDGGHIQLQSIRPDEQALYGDVDATGKLGDQADDGITVVNQNGSEAKIDYFLKRSITYDVTIDPHSSAVHSTATVVLTNTAPADGLPNYIIGGDPGGPTARGENRTFVSIYSPLDFSGVTLDGRPVGATFGTESGQHVATVLVKLPPGGSATLTAQLTGTKRGNGPYTIAIGHQPTVNPDDFAVDVKDTTGRRWAVDGDATGTRKGSLTASMLFSASAIG